MSEPLDIYTMHRGRTVITNHDVISLKGECGRKLRLKYWMPPHDRYYRLVYDSCVKGFKPPNRGEWDIVRYGFIPECINCLTNMCEDLYGVAQGVVTVRSNFV